MYDHIRRKPKEWKYFNYNYVNMQLSIDWPKHIATSMNPPPPQSKTNKQKTREEVLLNLQQTDILTSWVLKKTTNIEKEKHNNYWEWD